MTEDQASPASRFTNRVADYAASRPGYPEDLWDALWKKSGLERGDAAADLGSGTGISAEPLLERGAALFCVEPNEAMRREAEAALSGYRNFYSVNGTAEKTGLPGASVSLVVAAQSFHWFRQDEARLECLRILKPRGGAAVIWNERRLNGSPFLEGYERLLLEHGTDYGRVRHENVSSRQLAAFFGNRYEALSFPNLQIFDLEGLKSRVRSASYTPPPGHPGHAAMMEALERLFAACEEKGRVRMLYDARLYVGKPLAATPAAWDK